MKIRDTELKILKKDTGELVCDALLNVTSQKDEKQLRQALARAFKSAQKAQAKSVAFAVLRREGKRLPRKSGREGLSFKAMAKIMAQEIWKSLRSPNPFAKIIICLDQDKAFKVFETEIYSYLNHLWNDLSWGPYVTVDAIIELKEGIVLIERSNPPYGWALPGGFVDYGESLEQAVVREAWEETHMKLVHLRQFHTYSDPQRDPRFHTIGTVFIAKGKGQPRSGDDAKAAKIVRSEELLKLDYAFDHKTVIKDYLRTRSPKSLPVR